MEFLVLEISTNDGHEITRSYQEELLKQLLLGDGPDRLMWRVPPKTVLMSAGGIIGPFQIMDVPTTFFIDRLERGLTAVIAGEPMLFEMEVDDALRESLIRRMVEHNISKPAALEATGFDIPIHALPLRQTFIAVPPDNGIPKTRGDILDALRKFPTPEPIPQATIYRWISNSPGDSTGKRTFDYSTFCKIWEYCIQQALDWNDSKMKNEKM
jgi:hypothetical protein